MQPAGAIKRRSCRTLVALAGVASRLLLRTVLFDCQMDDLLLEEGPSPSGFRDYLRQVFFTPTWNGTQAGTRVLCRPFFDRPKVPQIPLVSISLVSFFIFLTLVLPTLLGSSSSLALVVVALLLILSHCRYCGHFPIRTTESPPTPAQQCCKMLSMEYQHDKMTWNLPINVSRLGINHKANLN